MSRRRLRVVARNGGSRAEILAEMSRSQWNHAKTARDARERVQRDKAAWDHSRIMFFRAVSEALNDGVPAAFLADELGLSVSRLYQLRQFAETRERALARVDATE